MSKSLPLLILMTVAILFYESCKDTNSNPIATNPDDDTSLIAD